MRDESQISIATQLGVHRYFLSVGNRRIHFVRAGNGPPVVLIHASPANVWEMLPAIEYLSPKFTCFAIDIPGLGLSEPLDLAELSLSDLADVFAESMRLIGLPPCPIYGRHTGAAIALELAVGHQAQVTGVVLDGLSIFTDSECESIFKGYFPPMPVDELGGHFAQTWTRFRDHLIWFPWFKRRPENLNQYDLAPPARIQNLVMMYYYAAKAYQPVYRAALSHGKRAFAAVLQLESPAVFTALETDMLYPHLDRLPTLKSTQEIRQIGQSVDRKHALIAESFIRFSAASSALIAKSAMGSSIAVARQFIDVMCGETETQLHVRYAGNILSPPLLLLHDAPGSALFLEPLIVQLSSRFFVCAPDMPGCGESAPLTGKSGEIADFAAIMLDLCARVDLNRPLVYGIGFGSSVAVDIANTTPSNLSGLIVRSVLLADAERVSQMRQRFAPEITLEKDGSHWYRTWQMLRDSYVYWPWYDTRKQSQHGICSDFNAEKLHAWTFDLMKQPSSHRQIIYAALRYDAGAALAQVNVPLVICSDPCAPLSAFDESLRLRYPKHVHLQASDDVEHANAILEKIGTLRSSAHAG